MRLFECFKDKINKNVWCYIVLFLFFLLVDVIVRYYCITSIYFYSIWHIAPLVFSLSIVIIHVLIIKILPKKIGAIFLGIIGLFYIIMALVQYFHFNILGNFFTFSEIFLAGEGLNFVSAIRSFVNIKIVILLLIFLSLLVLGIILILKSEHVLRNKKMVLISLIIAILLQGFGYYIISIDNNGYPSDNVDSLVYNYREFTIPYKSIQVAGFLQYPFQDIFTYYKNKLVNKIDTSKNKKKIDTYLSNRNLTTEENEYTGILKDKNLIYIMLESGDDWLVTKEDMPTLYKMMKEGMNFTNRYAPFFYAGYTFNTEFAANTGLYLVEGFGEYINNNYKYSLPNLFKNAGYSVNSFHMNSDEFYSRGAFHQALGYDAYNGNYHYDKELNAGFNYIYDTSWIRNDISYEKLVPKDGKFMSFLVTYSMHLPYFNNTICEQAIRDKEIAYKPWEKERKYVLGDWLKNLMQC